MEQDTLIRAEWFVIATLLPLASFVGLLLVSGLWCLARRYPKSPGMDALYHWTGGDKPNPIPAYVALGAIALAFVCSLAGFVTYGLDYYQKVSKPKAVAERKIHELEHELPELEQRRKELQQEIPEVAKEAAAEKGAARFNLELYLLSLELEEYDLGKQIPREKRLLEEAEERIPAIDADWDAFRRKSWKGRLFEVVNVRSFLSKDPERGSGLEIGYSIDSLSGLMFLMVTFVASLIHLFSMGYMKEELDEEVEDHHVFGHHHHAVGTHHEDPIHHHVEHQHYRRRGRFGRFFMYLSLFCFSMLNLVLASNLFQIFVSWELVGICSYLLIGFYYERRSAANAANKAFITNRVGDAGFIIGLMIIFGYVGTFDFDGLFARIRCPAELHAHGEEERPTVAGKFVRGNLVEDKGDTHFQFAPDGERALLFPKKPHIHAEELNPLDEHGKPNKLTSHGNTILVKANPEKRDPVLVTANPRPPDFSSMPYWMLVVAGLGIFLGCVGKSAQFPLQVWLPDAMEGPTPVSALIHAATMVAAGVYLVGRCYPLFTPEVLLVIAYVGGITLFLAATIAIVATDIKKVLAYSTVSQLGYMMLALGVGGWTAGLLHLFTHAFFKALLFLGSGSVIYGCHHEQEMTKMGGLFPKMKITALTMLAGVLAIAGTPLFSGWYSKDAIVAQAFGYVSVHREHALLFILPLMTAGITTFYMFRMWFMTFTGKPRDQHVYDHAHESPWMMTVPLIVLASFSVFVGWGLRPWMATESWLEGNIHHAQPVSVMADFGPLHGQEHFHAIPDEQAERMERHRAHELHELGGLMALGMSGLGFAFALVTYGWRYLDPAEAKAQFPAVHAFLVNKWGFDDLYDVALVRPVIVVARAFRAFDLNWIDGLIHGVARSAMGASRWAGRFDSGIVDYLVNVLGNATYDLGSSLRGLQTGSLRNYVLFLAIAAVGLFAVLAYFVSFAAAG